MADGRFLTRQTHVGVVAQREALLAEDVHEVVRFGVDGDGLAAKNLAVGDVHVLHGDVVGVARRVVLRHVIDVLKHVRALLQILPCVGDGLHVAGPRHQTVLRSRRVGGRLLRSDFVVDLIDKSTRLTVDFHYGEVDLLRSGLRDVLRRHRAASRILACLEGDNGIALLGLRRAGPDGRIVVRRIGFKGPRIQRVVVDAPLPLVAVGSRRIRSIRNGTHREGVRQGVLVALALHIYAVGPQRIAVIVHIVNGDLIGTGFSILHFHNANLLRGLLGRQHDGGASKTLDDAIIMRGLLAGLVSGRLEEGLLDGNLFARTEVFHDFRIDDVAIDIDVLDSAGDGIGFNLVIGDDEALAGGGILHLGFGLTGFGRRRALEYDGGVAREVLVVAGTSADRFRELVVFGIDRTDAEHLPLILARHGEVVDKPRVDGANSARVQQITAALRTEHFHCVGREIVRVAKHVLQRLRRRGRGLGVLSRRNRLGNLQRDNLGDARGGGIAGVVGYGSVGILRLGIGILRLGNSVGETRRDGCAVLLNLYIDGLPRAVFHAEEIPQAIFSCGGHEIDAVNVVALDRFDSRSGRSFCRITTRRVVGKGLGNERKTRCRKSQRGCKSKG